MILATRKERVLFMTAAFMWLMAVGTASCAVHIYRDEIKSIWIDTKAYTIAGYEFAGDGASFLAGGMRDSVVETTDHMKSAVGDAITAVQHRVIHAANTVTGRVFTFFEHMTPQKSSELDNIRFTIASPGPAGFINVSYDGAMPSPRTLSQIKQRGNDMRMAEYTNAQIEPAAGLPQWTPEQDSVTAEAVLVPRQVTVISSSQAGRIADIFVNHGETFKKGDLLIAYDCTDVEAEAEIARIQKDLTKKKAEGTDKLFKLDIISDIDRLGAQVEDRQASAKARAYDARMEDCRIRARFDGRVTNRLANPGEYTRTDRVLLEVASNDPLRAEFLLPSKWLRWVNIGAPVDITIGETEKTYKAKIAGIHGEVDPVSQSIQMVAELDTYADPLLPGMSGQVRISATSVRDAGIAGYLEAGYASRR